MFARVTTVQGAPDRVEEGIRQFREQAVPLVQGQPGFAGAYLLVNSQSGKGLAVSLWESEAAMTGSAAAVEPVRERTTQAMGRQSPPTVETYEVAVSDFPVNQ